MFIIWLSVATLVYADGFVDTASTFAQVVGSLVTDAKRVQNKLADNYEPYELGNEAADNPGAQKGIIAGALNSVVLGVDDLPDTLNKIAACNPDDAKGLCCLMPNYCVSNAECSAEKLSGNPLDLLRAVPTCKCRKGFTGDGRTQGTGCVNINECETGEALCEDICEDRSPGYACGCSAGYVLNSNGYSCDDIDECALGTAACAHICTNTRGSYMCSCEGGYTLAEDGKNCIDVDECALMKEIIEFQAAAAKNSITKPLSENAAAAIGDLVICEYPDLCVNVPGGYGCGCPAGFIADSGKCHDIDECTAGIYEPDSGDLLLSPSTSPANSICVSNDDQPGQPLSQQCLNLFGAFHCVCAPGFRIKESSGFSKNFAADLLALSLDRTNIDNADDQLDLYAKCVINALALECEDIDECTELESPCAAAKCVNTKGSYTCLCDDGYEFRGGQCRDIDECAIINKGGKLPEGMIQCDAGETCVNLEGSYACKCADGYSQVEGPEDGLSIKGQLPLKCQDINECLDNNGGCASGVCENRSPGYVCKCPVGYVAGGTENLQCVDINECELGFCPKGRKCINLPGSYLCGGLESQTTMTTELTRWVTQAQQLGAKIGAAKTSEEFTAAITEWNNMAAGSMMQKLTETFKSSSQNSATICTDLMGQFQLANVDDICPGDARCTEYGTDSFYCACPEGYQLSNDDISPTTSPSSSTLFSPSTIGGNLLGGLLGGTVGLLGGGRARRLAAALPGASAGGAAALLTTDELELAAELGVLSANDDGTPTLLVSPWVVREIKWDDYRLSGGFLPQTAKCQDIDECTAGLRASGDISSLCDVNSPCCANVPGSWTCSAKKRLSILGGISCPPGTVDLYQ